ncbi:tetrapyrrole-binding protein, chloroplastic, partial [Ananas comosus]|uniref:Tetrapyrrole-binding protein, chloroplastic n=1 Tax=Ananas comosus TaxID=4615 RepID=A0A6P5GH38_ANACO
HNPPLHRRRRHRHHLLPTTQFQIDYPSFSFKPTTTTTTTTTITHYKLFSNLSSSPLTTITTTTTTSSSSSLDLLAHHLSSSDFRRADDETRRLLIALAGEAAQKRGYVFFSEVQFISPDDLRAIDRLWRAHSGGRFGYSVQRRIWEQKARCDFTRFFIRVGWMRRLDTEVEQYNYCTFPDEFIWELNDATPEGHLPLTNALRGTQLLTSILTHPAFDEGDETAAAEESESEGEGAEMTRERPATVRRDFNPDYSF